MLIPHHLFRPRGFVRNYMLRNRVTNLFQDDEFAKVIIVEAPAGYGKSMAVAEFVQQSSLPVAWYPLELLQESEPLFFVWNLVKAIQIPFPQFGQKTKWLLQELAEGRAPGQKPQTTVLPALVTEMAGLGESLLIVVEDYHNISSTDIDEVMTYLIEYAPQEIRFIVTSRKSLRWSARPRWEGRELMISISADDLAFTQAESQELAHRMDVPLSEAQVNDLHVNTNGWPILHYFLYRNLRGKEPEQVIETLKILTHPAELIYDYLAEELLKKESPIVRDFLCRTSILRELEANICDALLGGETLPAAQLLDQLKNSLFLSRLGQSFVHSHDIVRDFLQQVMRREYGPEEVARLYERLGMFFEAQEKWDQAIASYAQGGHFAKASHLIEQQAQTLISAVQFTRLERWLEHLPREWLDQEPTLLVLRGIILAEQKNLLGEDYLRRAIRLLEEEGDQSKAAWARGELGWWHWSVGQYSQASKTLEEALSESAMTPDVKVRLLHYMAFALSGVSRFEDAILHGEQAIQLRHQLGSREDSIALSRLLRHLSHVYMFAGRLQDAVRVIEEAGDLARTLNLGDWALAWINNQQAELYRHQARFTEAHACLDEAERLLDKYRQLGSKSRLFDFVSGTRGNLYRDVYKYERAATYYRKWRMDQAGWFLSMYILQPEHAAEGLDLALQEWQKAQRLESRVTKALYRVMLGVAYMGVENDEQALFHLQKSEKVFRQYKARYYLSTTRIYLAKLYFARGDNTSGRNRLRDTLEQMAEAGFYNLDTWHPWIVGDMCAQAILEGIEVEFVKRLALKRLTSDHATPFLRLVNHPNKAVRANAIDILQKLGDTFRLEARQLLNKCRAKDTRKRLQAWMNAGWFTEIGLIRLKQLFSWRQIETLLLWICPHTQGSIETIADKMYIGEDTVNTNLRNVRKRFEDKIQQDFPRGKGAHSAAYEWAILEGIVDPHHSSSC